MAIIALKKKTKKTQNKTENQIINHTYNKIQPDQKSGIKQVQNTLIA